MINVTLYVRPECHLCEQAITDLNDLQIKFPHHLILIDIDTEQALQDQYLLDIPVVEIGPYRLKYPFSKQELEMTLAAAHDRKTQLERVDDSAYQKAVEKGRILSKSDKAALWIAKHYLGIFILFLLIYVGLPFIAPILKENGANNSAEFIYKIYRPLCHQWGFRSWFLFGEQAYYPHTEANIPGVLSFEKVSGITDQNDPSRIQARLFEGNNTIGFKVALCERDIAIWGAILLFGILFAISGRKIKELHWTIWLIIGIGPVALDGVSQLVSQLQLQAIQGIIPYRESTPALRTLTGFLFGFTTAWFGFPTVEEVMADTRRLLVKKTAIINSTPRK